MKQMTILKKGNVSPTGTYYNKCINCYYSKWQLKYKDGKIIKEKCISFNIVEGDKEFNRFLKKDLVINSIDELNLY